LFRKPDTFEERSREVDALTREQVRDTARRYFTQANLGVVAVGQKKGIRETEKILKKGVLPKNPSRSA
jgi:predicted Zn-dependent peptidase